MKIVLFSTDESVFALLKHLDVEDQAVALIYPENRRDSEKAAMFQKTGKSLGLPTSVQPYRDDVASISEFIKDKKPELGISWFYSQLIPEVILNLFPKGILNMHGGKIPEYRGASVLQWCIINGEVEAGVTWHSMVKEVDAGPIWARSTVPIEVDDNSLVIREKIINEGARLFGEFWPRFKTGLINPELPRLEAGGIWPQRRPEDSELPEALTRKALADFLRALCPPWPRPYVVKNEKKFEIMGISDTRDGLRKGFLQYTLSDGGTVFLSTKEATS